MRPRQIVRLNACRRQYAERGERCCVGDVVPSCEQGRDLAVRDAGITGVVHDRHHEYAHAVLLLLDEGFVRVEYFVHVAVHLQRAGIDPDRSVARFANHSERVADDKHSAGFIAQFADA